MTGSFAVCANKIKSELLKINRFHINLWQVSTKELYVDVGLEINIAKNDLFSIKGWSLDLYTPFCALGNEDLYETLKNTNILKLIFNDDPIIKAVNSTLKDVATYVEFQYSTREPLLLINPELSQPNERNDKIHIEIDTQGIDQNKLPDNINLYIRFRYKTSINGSENIFEIDGSFYDQRCYDIRINEKRLFPNGEMTQICSNLVKVETVFVFFIQTLKNKLSFQSKPSKNVRVLEKDWYALYVQSLKTKLDKYLVFFWKEDITNADNSYNLVIEFKREINSLKQVHWGIATNLFASVIFVIWGQLFPAQDSPILKPYLNIIFIIAAFLVIISIIIIAKPTIQYCKAIFREGSD